jgi:hypothetical protein
VADVFVYARPRSGYGFEPEFEFSRWLSDPSGDPYYAEFTATFPQGAYSGYFDLEVDAWDFFNSSATSLFGPELDAAGFDSEIIVGDVDPPQVTSVQFTSPTQPLWEDYPTNTTREISTISVELDDATGVDEPTFQVTGFHEASGNSITYYSEDLVVFDDQNHAVVTLTGYLDDLGTDDDYCGTTVQLTRVEVADDNENAVTIEGPEFIDTFGEQVVTLTCV